MFPSATATCLLSLLQSKQGFFMFTFKNTVLWLVVIWQGQKKNPTTANIWCHSISDTFFKEVSYLSILLSGFYVMSSSGSWCSTTTGEGVKRLLKQCCNFGPQLNWVYWTVKSENTPMLSLPISLDGWLCLDEITFVPLVFCFQIKDCTEGSVRCSKCALEPDLATWCCFSEAEFLLRCLEKVLSV